MPLRFSNQAKQRIAALTQNLPHATLLEGIDGIGLHAAAQLIAGKNLASTVQPTDKDGHTDTSAKGVIRVSQIRELTIQTRDKLTSRRVYIIDEADKMNPQAQAAFLKSLEEPVPHVHFILTSHAAHTLLPTVLSRVQRIRLHPISPDETKQFITKIDIPPGTTAEQLLFIASGRPAEIMRLVQKKDVLETRVTIMSDARTFLSGNTGTKITTMMKYANDRTRCLQFLESVENMVWFSLQKKPSGALVQLAENLANTYDAIAANSTIRLQLIQLVV